LVLSIELTRWRRAAGAAVPLPAAVDRGVLSGQADPIADLGG